MQIKPHQSVRRATNHGDDASVRVLLMILGVAAAARAGAGAGAGGRPSILGTPEARFWEEALPGIPMPEAIADMIQKGIWY
jgi:hypothetical protein